jgi:hypothetical protein
MFKLLWKYTKTKIILGKAEKYSHSSKKHEEIATEINTELTLKQKYPFLVWNLEIFYYNHFFYLIIEYCELEEL